jgi:hypothetical protein
MASDHPKQRSVCTSCGHRHKLTSHHKVPRSKAGTNAASNLVGVCRPCHDRIHGVGQGCQDSYPDLMAAAEACEAHWEIVMASWSGEVVRVERPAARWSIGPLIRQALEESEPRCT